MKSKVLRVKSFFVFFFLALAIVFSFAGEAYSKNNKIAYVPIDERPVCYGYVVDAARAAGIEMDLPPDEYMSKIKVPADVDKLWNWLFERAASSDVMILSSDTLIYGGLVPSRRHGLSSETLTARLGNFEKLKKINPKVKLYVFSTIMRSPKRSLGGVEPDYYEQFGTFIFQITALEDKNETDGLNFYEKAQIKLLSGRVPPAAMDDWLSRRAKNLEVNRQLMVRTSEKHIDYFILCRDDCYSFSQSRRDNRKLKDAADLLNASNFNSFSGADEVGIILLARAFNEMKGKRPKFFVEYTAGKGPLTVPAYEDSQIHKNVAAHVTAAGGTVVENAAGSDFVLAVNTPESGVTAEAESAKNTAEASLAVKDFAAMVKRHLDGRYAVAVADISCSNGSDNGLMEQLRKNGSLGRLSSYAGWNTAGNSMGYAVGICCMSVAMSDVMRKTLLLVRYLDEWAYQANIRKQVYNFIIMPLGFNRQNMGYAETMAKISLNRRLLEFYKKYLGEFGACKIEAFFPWRRMFEIRVNVDIQPSL